MSKMKAAFIGFMPAGITPEERFEVLKNYAALGYQANEVGDYLLQGDAEENVKRLNDLGMRSITTLLGKCGIESVPELVKKARILGVDKVVTFAGCVASYRFGGRELPPTYDEVMRELENYDAIAKELEKEGISLVFHNHDAEFKTYYNGKSAFYHMLDSSEYLKFEVDCGWVLYGGFDPVKVLKDVGSRLGAVHIKDFALGNVAHPNEKKDPAKAVNPMPRFTMVGTGFLPLKDCLKTARRLGIEYAIVEQDFLYHLTREETLRGAYLNMKETGYVE